MPKDLPSSPPKSKCNPESIAMEEPLTLTFGIELEFVLRFDLADHVIDIDEILDQESDYDDADIDDEDFLIADAQRESARDQFFHALAEKGFPTSLASFFDPKVRGVDWEVDMDDSIRADGPLSGPQGVEYGYVGIELKSPALPYTAESLVKIREMCQLLGEFDISVNQSCGLHVHVGNERKGFPLETIKNLCVMTATFERELESLHPPHRIGNRYTRSIGSLFDGISPRDIRRMIKKAETIEDLIKLVQKGDKRHAYNLLHLKSPKDESPISLQTFEFRQHDATLDADAITKWVELTCGLVDKAHRFAVQDHLGVGEMDVYMTQMSSLPQLNITKVLKSLGLGDVASYYDRRGLHTHPRALWSWADPNQENTMAPYVRPRNRVFLDGQQIVRTIVNSNENRQRYERAFRVHETAMTPWVRPKTAMTPWVRPEDKVFLEGQPTVRTVMNSNDNGQRYEQAVRGYDAEIPNHDPRGVQLGVAGSEECAHDSRDSFDTASTKVQFFSLSMPVERLSISQPNGSWSRTMSSTLPIMTRSIPTTAEMYPLSRNELSGRPVSAPDMASYTAINSPIRKIPATLAARSRGVSALPLRLIFALGYIPKLGSLSRAVKPKWSALSVAPKSAKPWTASTSDW